MSITPGTTEALLTWNDADGESEYVVTRWTASEGYVVEATLGADVTSHTISGLPWGTNQWFYVEARNAAGSVLTDWAYVDFVPN